MSTSDQLITQRRAEPAKMRDEMRQVLTEKEQQTLGINMGAGSDHPRAWVGPPFIYDLLGAMQFQLLIDLGMRENHKFLDVGCGSLRLGRLAINYLLENRYFGLEPNVGILNRGCEMHFGADIENSQVIAKKKATFAHNTDFDFSLTGGPVDFVFAQSIASHTGPAMTLKLLKAIADVSHDDTVSMVTYIRCGMPSKSNTEEGWFYPECVTYTDQAFGAFARQAGLHAYRTVWPATNIREDGLVTTQHPTILTKRPWKPRLNQRMTASLFEGIQKIN
jgi:hypothetical protein